MPEYPHDPIQMTMPRQMYDILLAALQDTGYTTIPDPQPPGSNLVVESYVVVPQAMEAAAREMLQIADIINRGKQPDV